MSRPKGGTVWSAPPLPTVSVPDVKTRLRPMGKGVGGDEPESSVAEAAGGSWCGRFGGGDLVAASGGSIQGGDPRLQGDPQAVVDRDARTGRKAPSAQQRAAARGKTVRWNRFGTPQLLTGDGDYLATGLVSDPVAAARA